MEPLISPVLPLLVMSTLDLQCQGGSLTCDAFLSAHNGFLRFTSAVTPAWPLDGQHGSESHSLHAFSRGRMLGFEQETFLHSEQTRYPLGYHDFEMYLTILFIMFKTTWGTREQLQRPASTSCERCRWVLRCRNWYSCLLWRPRYNLK